MSIGKFYELEARKLRADGEKIALFTSHPGTLGTFREARLRQYLAEHIPNRFAISGGFITDHNPDGENIYDQSSRQIDCLIHDATDFPPLLQAADFAMVVPSAVAAIVEVKSNLVIHKSRPVSAGALPWKDEKGPYAWGGTLVDALENIKSAIDILEAAKVPRDSYFAGILGYESSSIGQFVSSMTSGELLRQLDFLNLDQVPDTICALDGAWFSVSAYPWDEETESDLDDDPTWSFLLEGERVTEGSSLHLFTAGLNFAFTTGRNPTKHVVGGLRSGQGYTGKVTNHKVDLPSPRQHPDQSSPS